MRYELSELVAIERKHCKMCVFHRNKEEITTINTTTTQLFLQLSRSLYIVQTRLILQVENLKSKN